MVKQICEKHHFSYSGSRCPYCEKDRIGAMSYRFKRASEPARHEESINENLDWQDLAEKFNIITPKH